MKKTVLVGGCFDLIHLGHLEFLEKARALGNRLVVALESDEFIRKHKKRVPVHTQAQRARILLAIRYVDEVVQLPYLATYDDYLALVKKIAPDVIAVTGNDPQLDNKKKQAEAVGAKVVAVTSRIPGYSTSKIIETLTSLD